MGYRIIIAGGGTGGHIFPAVAIGHALQAAKPDTELLFVGAMGKMEMEKVPQEGFRIIGLDIAGFNRSNMIKNITLPYKLLKSAWQARKVINDFRPHAVVGVGGYASFPVLRAAQAKGLPTVIQEQNSHAGKSNILLGKKAKVICAAYEEVTRVFPKEKVVLTGNPVRKTIAHSSLSHQQGLQWFELEEQRKTLLIVGGSLGARSINEAVDKHLEALLALNINIVWQTGKPYYQAALKRAAQYSAQVKVYDFIRQMDYAYAAADVVLSRAGALAIAELCIVGKPVVFVPFPFAAEDHQTKNAMSLVKRNAALHIANSEVNDNILPTLTALFNDEKQQVSLGNNIGGLAIKDADDRIANEIFKIAKPLDENGH